MNDPWLKYMNMPLTFKVGKPYNGVDYKMNPNYCGIAIVTACDYDDYSSIDYFSSVSLYYRISHSNRTGNWTEMDASGGGIINVQPGDIVEFKGNNINIGCYNMLNEVEEYPYLMGMGANFKIYGNPLSIADGDNFATLQDFPTTGSQENKSEQGYFFGLNRFMATSPMYDWELDNYWISYPFDISEYTVAPPLS